MSAEPANGKTDEGRNNEAVLAGLYEEYYDKIARYVFARIGNRNEAEDIAGEVFLKALNSLKSYPAVTHRFGVSDLEISARYPVFSSSVKSLPKYRASTPMSHLFVK